MHAHGKNRRDLVRMAAAAVVAVVGITALVFMEVGKDDVQRNGISMITTAVVDRAGATARPSDPKLQPAIQNRSSQP